MNQKPNFTENELYIIEREFDNLHSLASKRYSDNLAQFFTYNHLLTKEFTVIKGFPLTPIQKEEELKTIQMRKEMISLALSLIETRAVYKGISDKIEKWRKSR